MNRAIATVLLFAAVGCTRSDGWKEAEARRVESLPPGVGPGAIGSIARIEPTLALRCTGNRRLGMGDRPFTTESDATSSVSSVVNGWPLDATTEKTFHCWDRETGVAVEISFGSLDTPPEWRDPVYEIGATGPPEKICSVMRIYANPFLTEKAWRRLGPECQEAAIKGDRLTIVEVDDHLAASLSKRFEGEWCLSLYRQHADIHRKVSPWPFGD